MPTARLGQAGFGTIWTESTPVKPMSRMIPKPTTIMAQLLVPTDGGGGGGASNIATGRISPANPSKGRNLRAHLGLKQVQKRIRHVQPWLSYQEILALSPKMIRFAHTAVNCCRVISMEDTGRHQNPHWQKGTQDQMSGIFS